MISTNSISFNKIQRSNNLPAATISGEKSWLDIIDVNNNEDLSKHYVDICQQHNDEKRWVLLVNPEDDSLDSLLNTQLVDTSKVLRVNASVLDNNLTNIELALCKGNCAAVVLCNTDMAEDKFAQLNACAEKGNTHCIIVNKQPRLH